MPGAVSTVGVIAAVAVVGVSSGALIVASVHAQRVASTADAAALAAADAASGAVRGVPCERATEVAASASASIVSCDVDGLIATVSVSAPFGMLPVSASARAGPPPDAR